MHRILLLPGDGIGPEVTVEARRVLEAAARRADLALEFEEALIGGASIEALGTPLADAALERARTCRAVILGAVGGPKWDGMPFAERPERGLLRIRKELGLFANLRPAVVFPALSAASTLRPEVVEGIDLLVVRELTGGIYFGEPRGEAMVDGRREARNTMVYDEVEIARIARVAFEAARRRRRELTHVHKANVLEVSQLWVQVTEEVAKDYPDVAPGRDAANPLAAILSAAMLLEHSLDAGDAAESIRRAVADTLADGHRTGDLVLPGQDIPVIGCREMGDRVLAKLEAGGA
jgi:3-isopropylmalate dehydrogenase